MYQKHMKITTRAWDRSWAKSGTSERGSASQFNPYIPKEEIEAIELGCTYGTHGEPIGEYPSQRTFFYEHHEYIGACHGEFTKFIYVIWQTEGSVHGYPISERELEQRKKAGKRNES